MARDYEIPAIWSSAMKEELMTRLRKEGRWGEANTFRERAMSEAEERGMLRKDAVNFGWESVKASFPPLPDDEVPAAPVNKRVAVAEERAERGRITGLDRIPVDWGQLPATVSVEAELLWVQANRLWVVSQTSSGGIKVMLGKAYEPAPSRSAIGWLETAIQNPAKFADLLAKNVGRGDDDEKEQVRRERKSIEEIREMLVKLQEK